MKALLNKLIPSPRKTKDTSKILAQAFRESQTVSLWQDTGELVYLLDTLNLSYESIRGLVTFEKLSPDDVIEILKEIENGGLAPVKQKIVAGQAAEFRLSICAMSWQTLNGNTRAKAIPEAAVLRSLSTDFQQSQAVFKHADLIAQHDPNVLSLPNQANVFTYNNIDVSAFFAQIDCINQLFLPSDKSRLSINRKNYEAPFTPFQSHIIASVENVIQPQQLSDKLSNNKIKDLNSSD